MAWVFRVYSYSHVKGCWSYQYREEGSWHTGMSGAAPPPLVGMDESRDKYLDHQSTATVSGRTHSNWAPTLPMPTHLVVRKRAVFSLGATRTHCSPFRWGKRLQPMGSTCGRMSPRHLIEPRRSRYDIELKTIFLLLKNS